MFIPHRYCKIQMAITPTAAFAVRKIAQSPKHRASASPAEANPRHERRRPTTPIEYATVDVTATVRISRRSEKDILETVADEIPAPREILARDASHKDDPPLDAGRPLVDVVCDSRPYAQSLASEHGRCSVHVL